MSDYKVYGISGNHYILIHIIGANNIFGFPYCENDRLWRKMLSITPERYNKAVEHQFDECNNAFVKPKPPVYLDLLNNLHKKSDFQSE
jgi:hypothetical protein